MRDQSLPTNASFLSGGGDLGALMRAHEWGTTALGPVETWPQSLRSAVSICINSRYPIALYWGQSLALLYNDAWSPILGAKHPWALGRPGRDVWPEIWDAIGPLYERAFAGEGIWQEDELLLMQRHGYTEECYFNFTFSPVRGEHGGVDGIFNAVVETTSRVIGERRTRVLRTFAERTWGAKSAEEACALACGTLAEAVADVPFALLYLYAADGSEAHLAGAAGLQPGLLASPTRIALKETAQDPAGWPVGRVAQTGSAELIDDLVARFGSLPGGAWPESPSAALVLPVTQGGRERPSGCLVMGISARRACDEDYRGFGKQIAGYIGTAIGNARAYEDERRRAEALEALDQAKTAFFSNVSHEFRTPLTLLLGPAEDALRDPGTSSENIERLRVIHRNALRLQKLVNTLLDFSRIEAGRAHASYQPTDLAALTADLASNFRSATERAGLGLLVNVATLSEPAFVDRDMWEKIVLNLLSNAFKFTLQGEIEVRLRELEGHVELVVRDTGSGIPQHELAHVFERFHRVEGTARRSHEGTGIGLALVQELVRLHGGTIGVSSSEGEGTAFTVTIPAGSSHLPAERVTAAQPLSIGPLSDAYVEEGSQWLPDAPAAPRGDRASAEGSALRPRIVLADDNGDMREYVRRLLSDRYDVTAVANGRAALEQILLHRPDLVLTDVMMPEMDGFELLEAIRRDRTLEQIPVILLSARAGEESRIEGVAAGADDYLIKPFSAKELLSRVEGHLKLQQLRRDIHEKLLEQLRLTATITSNSTQALLMLDEDGSCTFMNPAAEAMFGWTFDAVRGRPLHEVIHHLHPDGSPYAVTDCLLHGPLANTRGFRDHEEVFVRHDGTFFPALVAASPVVRDERCLSTVIEIRDITQQKQAENALRASAEALREADRMKDEFLATLSHELRTPLTAILGWAHMLGLRDLPVAEQKVALDTILTSAQAQAQLIEDVLDVSRITTGKMRLERQPADLAAIVEEAVATIRPAAEAKRIPLTLSVDRSLGQHLVDAARIQQVLWNLLSNAIKFSPAGAGVAVALRQEGASAVIEVTDQGRGIRRDFLPYIFERFRQADSSARRTHTGLGLGLALAKELTELHGGRIEVESEEGRGSRFAVFLPVLTSTEVAQIAGQAKAAEPVPLRGVRVLVVDDREDARLLLSAMLRQAGADAALASSAEEALVALAATPVDLVITDIAMPDSDGYDLLRAIRSRTDTPVVALTAQGGLDEERRALASGFSGYLRKPFEASSLTQAIVAILDARRKVSKQ